MPALLTSPAIAISLTSWAAAATEASSETSIFSGLTRSWSPSARSASSSLRTPAKTSKPACARRRAHASPIPLEAPVTMTVPAGLTARTVLGGVWQVLRLLFARGFKLDKLYQRAAAFIGH